MSTLGAFTFVLHTHLPYARLAGRWPHGEEWIHEAATETYIPLLETLYDLKDEGVKFHITFDITPVLAEQLVDPDVLAHLDQYLDDRIAAADKDIEYFQLPESEDITLFGLAVWYKAWFKRIKASFTTRFERDIIGAFRRLQDEGCIEIITSAATHAYLPLLARDSSIDAQLKTAVQSHTRLFGRAPTGIWLPECAYRPAYVTENGQQRPGLERILAENGLEFFFSETHTVTGGQPVGVAAGEVIGPYSYIKRRYAIPANPALVVPERPATTYKPYFVSNSSDPVAESHSDVVVIGRNNKTGMQVWSADQGYPGDFDYREFHKKAGTSGIQYWRVTGVGKDLGEKDAYHPDWADYKIDQHAEHFTNLVGDLLREYQNQSGEAGLITSNYDTELFGHWWFEGVQWLGKVLRYLASRPEIELTTVGSYLKNHPPTETLMIPEGSWGSNGSHFTWDNIETHWMWEPIAEAEQRMENLAARFEIATDDELTVLRQTAREAFLLQSSDWPFLVTTGQAREYAIQRFSQHLERFNKLADSLEKGKPDTELAAEYWELDKIFPDIDYRWFRARDEG